MHSHIAKHNIQGWTARLCQLIRRAICPVSRKQGDDHQYTLGLSAMNCDQAAVTHCADEQPTGRVACQTHGVLDSVVQDTSV